MSDPFRNPFRTAPGSDPPHLVGRDAELNSAHIALGMTASGEPSPPVIITGLRGMGKTVLLRRAAAEARSGRGIVVYAEGSRREPLTASLRFRTLTPRECRYVLALTKLGAGAHTVQEVADVLGFRSDQVSSIRNQLLKKGVLFAPNGGMVEFRIPLSDRYINEHRAEITRRASVIAKRRLTPSTQSVKS